ncbi:hypothetical protein PG988_009128 [Apiospora saccharicola]
MPPSYGTKEYWDARFERSDNYEWLLPADSLNAVVREALRLSQHRISSSGGSSAPPQILHIGCGSSDVSFQLRGLVDSPRQVTNVDYSENAVRKCRQREAAALLSAGLEEGGGGGSALGMRWETAGLLAADSIARLGGCNGENGPFLFDVVADKSTCDAMGCADDAPVTLPFVLPRDGLPPRTDHSNGSCNNRTANNDNKSDDDGTAATTARVHPMYLLALHMAVLTPPRTGRWCAISYSDDRFSGFPDPRRFWRVERKERVTVAPPAAATGSGGHVVHQPEIAYWLYVLGRTEGVV